MNQYIKPLFIVIVTNAWGGTMEASCDSQGRDMCSRGPYCFALDSKGDGVMEQAVLTRGIGL